MDRLPNETLDNAISVYKTTIEVVEENKDSDYCTALDKATLALLEELKEYRDAEEQGLLVKLPVAIGSDIYFVPSEAHYDLNVLHNNEKFNRVYHQKVAKIVFNKNGWYLESDINIEYGVKQIYVQQSYKVTWFTDEAEAEQMLEQLKKNCPIKTKNSDNSYDEYVEEGEI